MKWFVPGRIEVFGKHTDYAGGASLLCAVEQGVTVEADEAERGIEASSSAFEGSVWIIPGEPLAEPAGHWGHYVQAAVDRLAANFGELVPTRLRFSSTLPLASGMSSSSALVVATAMAVAERSGLTETDLWREQITDRIDLAQYLATMENGLSFKALAGARGVGTLGGAQDHTGMLACREGHLTHFRWAPTERLEDVALPDEWRFVVAFSGVLAEKTGAALEAYNSASQRASAILERWNDVTGREDVTLGAALEVEPEGLWAITAEDPALERRLRAFVTESALIPKAVAALREGAVETFGGLALESHRNADEHLGNQVPATNRLVALATELGAAGASAFGAGFGGSVWALVKAKDADGFAQAWGERYSVEFPDARPEFLVTRASRPADRLSDAPRA